jgi:hypothetical protein
MRPEIPATLTRLLTKRTYFSLLVVVALVFPAAAYAASTSDSGSGAEPEPAISVAHAVLTPLQRSVAQYRHLAKTIEHRVRVEYRAAVRHALHEKYARLPGSVSIETLESIAACESGGDPRIVSSDGSYRGKYQFDQGTWESVGGHGDPAAAAEIEQDYRAALLYSRSGSSPWPVCG